MSHMLGSSGLFGEAYLGNDRMGQQVVPKYFKSADMDFGEFRVDRFMGEVRWRCCGSVVGARECWRAQAG